jgi:hypothetical protein
MESIEISNMRRKRSLSPGREVVKIKEETGKKKKKRKLALSLFGRADSVCFCF